MHHAPLAARLRQQFAHGGHRSRAPVARHQPDALQTTRDDAGDELAPAFHVLLHALRHRKRLAPAVGADADRDEHAHVLHAAAS